MERELCGFDKGEFTDGKRSKKGWLEIAGQGRGFLDEIGELPSDLQDKLRSELETRRFRRIGGTRLRTLDARVIAATNSDLAAKIREGSFRDDLFYRLNVFTISLPSLSERVDDIELLARHFMARFGRKYRKRVPELGKRALERLQHYHWPGNVRELSHVMENVTLLNDGGIIQAHHLGLSTERSSGPAGAAAAKADFEYTDPNLTRASPERRASS